MVQNCIAMENKINPNKDSKVQLHIKRIPLILESLSWDEVITGIETISLCVM